MPSPLIKVLVVDDTDANRYAVSHILQTKGAEVLEATTGRQAIELSQRIPDLVLMDIHLPDMTAYDVLESMRNDGSTKNIPVVLMSAVEPAPHARSMAQALGVRSFLTVPVLSNDLWIVVQAAVRKPLDRSTADASD